MGNSFSLLDTALGNDTIACRRWAEFSHSVERICQSKLPVSTLHIAKKKKKKKSLIHSLAIFSLGMGGTAPPLWSWTWPWDLLWVVGDWWHQGLKHVRVTGFVPLRQPYVFLVTIRMVLPGQLWVQGRDTWNWPSPNPAELSFDSPNINFPVCLWNRFESFEVSELWSCLLFGVTEVLADLCA